jgi:phosphoesterase RecJ-like protein
MKKLEEVLQGVTTVAIAGHIRPDGDCVGTCMGLYLYLIKNYPHLKTDVYLEEPAPVFSHIDDMQKIRHEVEEQKAYDLFITCDVSSRDRIGAGAELFDLALQTVCIDHHISNPGFAMINHIRGEIGSASEVLYGLLDPDKIDRSVATALYTGMIHDTGVFQYSSTTPETMRIAGELMKTGFDFHKIIDESFYQKTYLQNQIMGRVLTESILLCEGTCIVGYIKRRDMEFYGVTGKDLDGIVSQLRLTKGVRIAIFLYEMEPQVFKVSLRSNGDEDVSKVAVHFGGGGHAKAAGVTMQGSMYDVINNITGELERQNMTQKVKGE